jgi:hypothetical protein
LRTRLIVVEDELQRLAMNAAVGIGLLLELLERLLLRLAEKGAAAGQRQDDVDLTIGGLRRGETAEKSGGNEKSADAHQSSRIFWRFGAFSGFPASALSLRF